MSHRAEPADGYAHELKSPGARSVLVVSRDQPGLDAVIACLAAEDRRVERAYRLDAALRVLEAGPVDAILLDLILPDSTGLSTVQRLARQAPDIAIVAMVDQARATEVERVLAAGAQDTLSRDRLVPLLVVHCLDAAVARHQVSADLREREARLTAAFAGTDDGLWDWDTGSGVVFYSARFNAILGLPERDLVAPPGHWLDRVHDNDRPSLSRLLNAHLEGESRHFEHEHRVRTPEGEERWVLLRGCITRSLGGGSARVAGSLTEITKRKAQEDQLRHRALHDPLTGLTNRMLLTDRINLALSGHGRRITSHFAVLYIDLDRFKRVNDQFGHAAGDELLIGIGKRLKHFVRPSDTVARLGGDEFAVLLAKVRDVSHATHVAERMLSLVACPFPINGSEVRVTASVGIALSTSCYETAEDMLHDADVAMYRAKSIGPGRCQVYDPQLHDSAMALLRLERELRTAVEHDAFVMHYQPIVDLELGKISGFEGLVRWRHPERGLVPPAQFLGVAEETGLMVPIGWWVLRQGCRQMRQWQLAFPSEPPLYLSVNVSCKLLMQADMVDRLASVLDEEDLEPCHLRLELREQGVLERRDAAAARLLALRRSGVGLSIDDFGTGYSSLTHLQRLRYDTLKIDPSFVCSLANGGEARPLVETILTLASLMGIGVVAEGIETADQAAALRRLRCPHGQGFWFAKPVTARVAERLLSDAPSWWKA